MPHVSPRLLGPPFVSIPALVPGAPCLGLGHGAGALNGWLGYLCCVIAELCWPAVAVPSTAMLSSRRRTKMATSLHTPRWTTAKPGWTATFTLKTR